MKNLSFLKKFQELFSRLYTIFFFKAMRLTVFYFDAFIALSQPIQERDWLRPNESSYKLWMKSIESSFLLFSFSCLSFFFRMKLKAERVSTTGCWSGRVLRIDNNLWMCWWISWEDNIRNRIAPFGFNTCRFKSVQVDSIIDWSMKKKTMGNL